MEKIVWDESFSVGSVELDKQHRHLAELINSVADCDSAVRMQRLLSRLTLYALYHFGREEQLMEECGFPGVGKHVAEHEEFCQTTLRMGRDTVVGIVRPNELFRFLSQWWSHHVLDMDMQYKPYLMDRQ